MNLDLIQTPRNLKWSEDRIAEPKPQPESPAVASGKSEVTLEVRRQITALKRLMEVRRADKASACALSADIDHTLLILHRV